MWRWLALAALASGGCRYLLDDAPGQDAAAASPVDAEDLCGFGAGVLSADGFCLATPPQPTVRIDSGMFDTRTDPGCLALDTGGDYCVVAGGNVTVSGAKVIGDRPLIIIATGQLDVLGPLDLEAELGATQPVPGARECTLPTVPALSRGGAGGSFGTDGGTGGMRDGPGAKRTVLAAIVPPAELVGGCAGQAHTPGGGGGGGAIYLISRRAILLTSRLDASGAAGLGGVTNAGSGTGGGGGGSGGMIVLDAPSIDLAAAARVVAHGGGGGEGGGGQEAGQPGTGTTGGSLGAARGGDGGDGASMISAAQRGETDEVSGGGGGGGFGGVWLRGARTGAGEISPEPLVLQN